MVLTDFTKAPEQIVVDLINYDNGSALTASAVTFGTPTVFTGTRNTKLTVTASATSHYTGSVDLTYNRVDLATVPGIRNTVFPIGNATSILDLIPLINAAYQLNLTPANYINAPLPVFSSNIPNEEKSFNLISAPGSLIFIGQLTLSVKRNDVPLSSVIVVTALNGLVYIQPVP